MERMYRLGPEFIDVTWNAGGTSSQLTSEIVATAQSVYGLETVMHLTCTNMPKEKIDKALKVTNLPFFLLINFAYAFSRLYYKLFYS
jgi:5,10-methylenetetrahydrofolate reductase